MKKADLHCHSVYSEHPSEWFLQKLGAKESYTDPMIIYQEAKRQASHQSTIACADWDVVLDDLLGSDQID